MDFYGNIYDKNLLIIKICLNTRSNRYHRYQTNPSVHHQPILITYKKTKYLRK